MDSLHSTIPDWRGADGLLGSKRQLGKLLSSSEDRHFGQLGLTPKVYRHRFGRVVSMSGATTYSGPEITRSHNRMALPRDQA